jgi:hypothetical protein
MLLQPGWRTAAQISGQTISIVFLVPQHQYHLRRRALASITIKATPTNKAPFKDPTLVQKSSLRCAPSTNILPYYPLLILLISPTHLQSEMSHPWMIQITSEVPYTSYCRVFSELDRQLSLIGLDHCAQEH